MYKPVARNFEGVQHEQLRNLVDSRFNAAHDALSAAYYEHAPFTWKGRDFGMLDKATFDRLHALIFHLRDVALAQENQTRGLYSRDEVDPVVETGQRRSQVAGAAVAALRAQGLELVI